LQEHARLHFICLESLLEMDGAIIIDNRSLFAENCEKLCENALEYVGLVKKHQQRLQRDSFLEYPCSPGGHEFYVLNGSRVATCIFNEPVTCAGAISEIEKIQEKVIDFKIKSNPLPYIALPLDEQQGAGLLLPDLKNNLIRNELLLKRVNEKS